jgi:hypothetical protein
MAKDISELPRDLDKLFNDLIGPKELEFIATWVRDTIYKRTKSGKGLKEVNRKIGGTSNKSIDDVSEEYSKWRKGKITGPFPKSGLKSNLTFTGELLESMRAMVRKGQAVVEIPKGRHSSGVDLQKLLDDVEIENGRPFFGLSDTEMKTLDSMIRRMIRDKLRVANKK